MTDDDPITLNEACVVFRGTLTPATLRAEADRGRLTIFKIGRRYYTTKSDVDSMVKACRDAAKAPDSPSIEPEERGPSEMERARSAQAALSASVIKLRKSSRSI